MCLIKELGSLLKSPPRLHLNMPKSTAWLVQVGLPNLSAHSPNQDIPTFTWLLRIYTTWVTLKSVSFPCWNGIHLNHQVIWIPFKELTTTLRKCKNSKPTIPFQLHSWLHPWFRPVVLDLHFPKKQNLYMNSPQSPSVAPQTFKTFIVIQG